MMQDMAMYLLDIANNSIEAKALNIYIYLAELEREDRLILSVTDDGCGMDQATLEKVVNPFYTTRTTRKIGLGIAFFKALADACDGKFTIESEIGKGTFIKVDIRRSHLDTPPLGDIAETILTLIQASETIEYIFRYQNDQGEYIFDTRKVKEILDGVSICEPSILLWIKDYLNDGMNRNNGGKK